MDIKEERKLPESFLSLEGFCNSEQLSIIFSFRRVWGIPNHFFGGIYQSINQISLAPTYQSLIPPDKKTQ
jgi:hypothetical protein